MTPQRYDLVTNYRAGSSIEEMERADDGEWVRYEDTQLDAFRECLRDIIYASDGCVGHRDCNHSIEPWKRARHLLWPETYPAAPPAVEGTRPVQEPD